ncbi:MAG: Rpn family recombination-promoting nuclease/putative transposase [Microcystis sp. M60BS1]|nr:MULTISPECIES: Rpn family recombination-promoting nuclease/putative transposase [unclassified Microcystis]MBE5230596.1 Rpn family recombination-promoting nuclease/putative transposase [Microcystis aeruginosa PMC 728.11]MCA2505725.1 Rpn family recombination-promoting nuclease/putative transposase [Microcystis sp. M62BS1]MCA2509720.1 Rpn family recombination-promoting nuclease/putative transposase [Microcystis sp. M60BS1]
MFDNTCKFLAENFSEDFASWLLGEPLTMTQLSPSELSLEPIRADALILLNSDSDVLHIEFQTEPDPIMPFRMADYRLRSFRRFPQKRMRQVVIYLTRSTSPLVHQTAFEIPGTRHEFEVIRLWEQPTQTFLEATGLLPLAVLTQTPDTAQTLRQIATRIEAIPDQRIQSNVAASTGILAGLLLNKELINQVLRRDIMQQSVIYQEWREEFLQEGRQEGESALVLRQLSRRLGEVTPEQRSQIQSLSINQLEALGEALLDFTKPEDLEEWWRSLL